MSKRISIRFDPDVHRQRNRAETGEVITPDNFRPNPKNPIIASLKENGLLVREGARKNGRWIVKQQQGKD